MNKELEFASEIASFTANNQEVECLPSRLIKAARFCGIEIYAKQNNISVSSIADLDRVETLRVNMALEDEFLIPFDKGIKPESFETEELLKLLPQSVIDSLRSLINRRGAGDLSLRRKIIRHFVTADFIRHGLPEVDQSVLRSSEFGQMTVRELVEEKLSTNKQEGGTTSEKINLGNIKILSEISSTLGPFEFASDYETVFPSGIVIAIGELVNENAQVFSQFVTENAEGDELAYQYSVEVEGGIKTEPFFQVDIAGFSRELLENAGSIDRKALKEAVRNRIFEFEPSIAMYELVGTVGGGGLMGRLFRKHLDLIRKKHHMSIVLLAPTKEKMGAIRETEFGKVGSDKLHHEEVKRISGFDDLLGPDEFLEQLKNTGGNCTSLLYVRPSDPTSKLRNPSEVVRSPLLSDPKLRQIIRQNSITLNVDNPNLPLGDPRRIKDSKVTLPIIGIGFRADSVRDIVGSDISERPVLTDSFKEFMRRNGLTQLSKFRAKPIQGVFGGYGQKTVNFMDRKDLVSLEQMILERGPYVIQPEIEPLIVIDEPTARSFGVIDRVFFSMVTGTPTFMGGVRVLIPTNSEEFKMGRLHGNCDMISAPILSLI